MDLIDRQGLLVEARKLNSVITGRDKPIPVAKAFMEVINKQPTIEPRAKGAWIEVYDSGIGSHNSYTCSNCGLTIVTNPDYLKKHKFCFACGADMRESDETD